MSIKKTLQESASLLEISVDEIISTSRRQDYVFARVAITMLLRQEGYTFIEIAKALNRTHGAINHHVKIYDSEIKHNKRLQKYCEQLNITRNERRNKY